MGGNWLLVEWKSGGLDVVYIEAVVSPSYNRLRQDEMIMVNRFGEPEEAILVARARERAKLDAIVRQAKGMRSPTPSEPSSTREPEEESDGDFSSSASSWMPSGDEGAQSADSDEIPIKKNKLEQSKRQYSNKSTIEKEMTPTYSATPVLPRSADMQQRINEMMRQMTVNTALTKMGESFKAVFKMIEEMKLAIRLHSPNAKLSSEEQVPVQAENLDQAQSSSGNRSRFAPRPYIRTARIHSCTKPAPFRLTVEDVKEEEEEEEIDSDTDSNRSGDNVLITNKYTNAAVKTVRNKAPVDDQWVPIGSGQTLIHKDKFRKVKWSSYTIATRTLLLAVFPRRVLATHSLTGRRSPAFQDKPAKMCLDPKITSDIIYEVMDRFNVKENLVRSIITTKCADECKMWKTHQDKKSNREAKQHENKRPPPPLPVIYLDEDF